MSDLILPSNPLPEYTPAFQRDKEPTFFGELVNGAMVRTNVERARTSYSILPQWYTTRDGLADIRVGADVRKYDKLARTHRDVAMAIRTIVSAAFWVEGKVEAQNDYTTNPEFEAIDDTLLDLINRTLDNFAYQSYAGTIEDLLYSAKVCGFTVAEKVWEKENGENILAAIKTLPSWDFNPVVDEWRNLVCLFYYPVAEYFHPGAFVFGVWPRLHAGNYLGMSDLESVRHDILLLEKKEEALAKTVRGLSTRPLVHTFDPLSGTEAEALMRKRVIAEGVSGKSDGVIHLIGTSKNEKNEWQPEETLEVLDDRTGFEALKALAMTIAESKKEIKRALGLPDDLGSSTVNSGSWAKASQVFDIFVSSAESAQRWIAALINSQIISDIIQYNYPDLPKGYKRPKWVFPEIQEAYSKDKAVFITTLVEKGVLDLHAPEDVKYARDFLGLPVASSETIETPPTPQPSGPGAQLEIPTAA